MEKIKTLVIELLNRATIAYIRRNNIQLIAVAGSIGKTSTVNAIRTVLAQKYLVHTPKTAYNTNKSVHLEIFDQRFATSTFGWLAVTCKMLILSMRPTETQVIVIEIGTDHPGEMASFAWLQPRIGVLTAVTPEHMENFKTIEAVAAEELSIVNYCQRLVMNAQTVSRDFVPADVLVTPDAIIWYGEGTAFGATNPLVQDGMMTADFVIGPDVLRQLPVHVAGLHSLQALAAAGTVASVLGLTAAEIEAGLRNVHAVAGRMQLLAGIKGSIIIDDSYNASPDATKAALDTLYELDVVQRVAILGSMNEMGEYSSTAHHEVGDYCDPSKLDLVVTVGDDAETYLAPQAIAKGCAVRSFASPYAAGAFVNNYINTQAGSTAVLVKGSQNRVFAEESIKSLLADPDDAHKLVRQSDFWMRQKRAQFNDAPVASAEA